MGVYEDLGIKPFINAYRPLTRLGGSTIPEAVLEAMRQASQRNVDVKTLQQKVGHAIALLTQNEAAYVSCGAASGIILATAACMAGTDPVLSEQLPNTDGMKNEFIMQACDRGYKCDVAIRCAGGKIVDVGDERGVTAQQLSNAINDKTAAIFVVPTESPCRISVAEMIAIAHEHSIPVLVDAAFLVPPKESLWIYTRDMGADAVFISGGKGLRGPQCTGLVLGKPWIVRACAFHGFPNDRIGRGMKVGKEELAGIYEAVKIFMGQDDRKAREIRTQQLDFIIASAAVIPNVVISRLHRTMALLRFDTKAYGFTSRSARDSLLQDDPSIYFEPASEDGLLVSTDCLERGEERIVANQLRKFFNVKPLP